MPRDRVGHLWVLHAKSVPRNGLRERRDLECGADEPSSLVPRQAIDPFSSVLRISRRPHATLHLRNPMRQMSPDFEWVAPSPLVRAPQLRPALIYYLTNPHFTDFVVPNSDRVLTTVDVGFSTIVWTRTLLNVTAQFGITGHVLRIFE
jgi:hypothetical protein